MEIHLINGVIIRNIIHISQLNGVFNVKFTISKSSFTISETKINCIEIDTIEITE